MEAGFEAYLLKPVEAEDLHTVLGPRRRVNGPEPSQRKLVDVTALTPLHHHRPPPDDLLPAIQFPRRAALA
jgi:hypothetical protein